MINSTIMHCVMEEDLENEEESGEVEDDHGGEHHQQAPEEHEAPSAA